MAEIAFALHFSPATNNKKNGISDGVNLSLNALFVVGRSIGIFDHIFDQKRLAQPLWRVPYDDIAYMTEVK